MLLKTLAANIVFLFLMQWGYAQNKDSIITVKVSDKLERGNLHYQLQEMDYPFFDMDKKWIYYEIKLTENKSERENDFCFLEIKKKSNIQYKLKPLYQKKIDMSEFKQATFIDSVSVDQAQLMSGTYEFLVYWMADSSRVLHLKKAEFQLMSDVKEKSDDESYYHLNIQEKGTEIDFSKTFVSKYTMEQLKRNILALKPISVGVEEKVLLGIVDVNDLKFLQQFFYNFWYNRNASAPEEEWKKYALKLNEVAKLYGTASSPGHQTDRGRIYLKYGEPDKKERMPNEKDAYPYEIWFYRTLENKSNVSFLFYQPGTVGTPYYLLHSNFEQEVINPYWAQELFLEPDNPDNKLMHRVYEFFK
ncbi:MAG TPA: GWxTD domain-containing protein [Chitinophagaceae bacterium]|nr:MAG: hypothetical protein UZ11_BCD004001379 [Bacteroidetes bacterium OLB11]HMN33215.1 GWxTD domain-containing protein [Chitinophagaceae bacterium]